LETLIGITLKYLQTSRTACSSCLTMQRGRNLLIRSKECVGAYCFLFVLFSSTQELQRSNDEVKKDEKVVTSARMGTYMSNNIFITVITQCTHKK